MESVSDSEESGNAFEGALCVVRGGRHGLLFSGLVVIVARCCVRRWSVGVESGSDRMRKRVRHSCLSFVVQYCVCWFVVRGRWYWRLVRDSRCISG